MNFSIGCACLAWWELIETGDVRTHTVFIGCIASFPNTLLTRCWILRWWKSQVLLQVFRQQCNCSIGWWIASIVTGRHPNILKLRRQRSTTLQVINKSGTVICTHPLPPPKYCDHRSCTVEVENSLIVLTVGYDGSTLNAVDGILQPNLVHQNQPIFKKLLRLYSSSRKPTKHGIIVGPTGGIVWCTRPH